MKKTITLISFFTLFIFGYSEDFSSDANISIQSIVLEEDLQLIIPNTENNSASTTFVVDLNELEKDIYPSEDQIVLVNNKGQELLIDDNLNWYKSDDQTFVNIDESSKEKLMEFLASSEDFDFHIFKTNTLYTLEDIPISYFKNLYLTN